MYNTVAAVLPGSPAAKSGITAGDVLRRINGHVISDVLDYEYYSYNSNLFLELTGCGGIIKLVYLRKPEGRCLGLEFETFLIDRERSCINKCIFCFIDQLPAGMRKTLYYKDDDVRLSFLEGNYVTLTNLTEADIERIIRLRISPVNISVHTLNPRLRRFMLGNRNSDTIRCTHHYIERLARCDITLNCQIVCCPGINDGDELESTIKGLMAMGPGINSVSIVPVGLTKHREGLFKLKPFDKETAIRTVDIVQYYGRMCLKQRGSRVFYCSDEMYMLAGLALPEDSFYEDYPQLENGVGMMRLFIAQFIKTAKAYNRHHRRADKKKRGTTGDTVIVTGTLAAPYLSKLIGFLKNNCGIDGCRVFAVKNEFFGKSITVSGLVTGRDIIKQLRGIKPPDRVLIPQNMLRTGEDIFLDDITITELSETLGVQVDAIAQNGKDFFNALAG